MCNQLSHPYPLLRRFLEFIWDWGFGSEGLANSSWDHVIQLLFLSDGFSGNIFPALKTES
jgi:hypothetical protein